MYVGGVFIDGAGVICHVGMYVGNGRGGFIDTFIGAGVVCHVGMYVGSGRGGFTDTFTGAGAGNSAHGFSAQQNVPVGQSSIFSQVCC